MKNQLTVWALMLLLMGCKVTKDNRAYTRVVSNPTLAEHTYRTLAISHPCVTTYVVGKDSIVRDTVEDLTALNTSNRIVDSLLDKILNHPADTSYLDVDSLRDALYAQIKKTVKPVVITNTITRHDTAIDGRQVAQLTGDNNVLKGQAIELNSQVASLKKANTHKALYLGGAALIFLIGVFLRIKKVI